MACVSCEIDLALVAGVLALGGLRRASPRGQADQAPIVRSAVSNAQ
jgi:hypothetical protein